MVGLIDTTVWHLYTGSFFVIQNNIIVTQCSCRETLISIFVDRHKNKPILGFVLKSNSKYNEIENVINFLNQLEKKWNFKKTKYHIQQTTTKQFIIIFDIDQKWKHPIMLSLFTLIIRDYKKFISSNTSIEATITNISKTPAINNASKKLIELIMIYHPRLFFRLNDWKHKCYKNFVSTLGIRNITFDNFFKFKPTKYERTIAQYQCYKSIPIYQYIRRKSINSYKKIKILYSRYKSFCDYIQSKKRNNRQYKNKLHFRNKFIQKRKVADSIK